MDGCRFSEKDGLDFTFIWVPDRRDRRGGIRDGWTRDESERNWHLEYKMAAWLHGETSRVFLNLAHFSSDRNFNFKWVQVSISFNFMFFNYSRRSESIRVYPTRTGGPSWSSPTLVPACYRPVLLINITCARTEGVLNHESLGFQLKLFLSLCHFNFNL